MMAEDSVVARDVLDKLAAGGLHPGHRFDGVRARRVAETWLRTTGWTQDRWGNWKAAPTEVPLDDNVRLEELRVVLTDRSFKLQRKVGDRWVGVRTDSIIDWATKKMLSLSKAAGTDINQQHAQQAVSERRTAKLKAADRRKLDELYSQAHAELRQRALWRLRAQGVLDDHLRGVEPVEFVAERPEAQAMLARVAEQAKSLAQARFEGRPDELEPQPWSLDFPPLPWLDRGSYTWTENGRTVSFAWRDGAVEFLIGRLTEFGFGVDPRTFRVRMSWQGDREGDGYVSGVVRPPRAQTAGGPRGPEVIVMLVGAHEKRQGVGRKLVGEIARLVYGYRGSAFMVEALTDEGRSFFEHLVARGDLEDLGPVSTTGQRYGLVMVSYREPYSTEHKHVPKLLVS